MDKRIGAQLYTVRNLCKTKEGLDDTFAKLSKIGYKTAQISGIGPIDPKDVREVCDKYQIEPICTHRSIDEYLNDLDATIKYHEDLKCDIAGIGYIPEMYRGIDGIKDFINKIKKPVEAYKKIGKTLAYHNHAFEFEKIDGKFLMDYILEDTDLDFITDVYWLSYAGINPADYIKKVGSRIKVIHFKDLAIKNNEIKMAEVMNGNLDWDSIIDACEKSGVGYAMVEQDICDGDPIDSMEISYNNLKTKGFN